MIIDSSALVAILKSEQDAEIFADAILDSPNPVIGTATLIETAIVIDRYKSEQLSRELDTLISDHGIRISPLTTEMVQIARNAFQRFGKGMGHPAQLNFGDCMAYAVAKCSGQPLLFKGNDFAQTDIESAL